MTIRFLRDYQGYPSDSEVSTLSTREEDIAIAAGAATRTLGDQQLSIYPSDSAGGVRPENGPVRLVNGSLVSGDGSFLYGPVTSGTWMKVPSLFRLRITGTGTLQMDSKDSLGNITLATFPLTSYTGATDTIEFPYAGDDAVTIRVTLTGTLTCEVI